MSALKGIAKNLSALFSSHVINALQQVALTPLFIHVYRAAGYGEWLTLSAAVSYLGTLDFGVQTFVNQDLTVRYHRGDMEGFHVQQSTALRLMLGIVAVAAVMFTSVFLSPLQVWLKMDGRNGNPIVGYGVVQWTIFLLAIQVLAQIPFGFLSGNFMVVNRAHVGAYWNNFKSLSIIVSGLITVSQHLSFAWVAAGQLIALSLSIAGVLTHLRLAAPQIFPQIRHWDRSIVAKIMKPSGYFALIYSCTFLSFQVPVLIIQRLVGPVAVAAFSLMRIIFSMSRQILAALTQALGPEITQQFAKGDWKALAKIYNVSERLIFSAIPFFSVGVLAVSPLVMRLWVNNPSLFSVWPYCVCAMISILMATKEHKLQFQFSTNTHQELGRFMFSSYLIMIGISLVTVPRFGVLGFMWTWLVVEVGQLAYTVHLNRRLFQEVEAITLHYLISMMSIAVGGVVITAYCLKHWIQNGNLVVQIALPITISLAVLAISYPVFGLGEVIQQVKERLRRRRSQDTPLQPSTEGTL